MQRRLGPFLIALPSLGGAVCALVIPGVSSAATAGASLLAVGALALLAGHTWGLLVMVPSHLTVVGQLWPQLALLGPGQDPPGGALGLSAMAAVLVTALPALGFAAAVLPRIVSHVLTDRSPRAQSVVVATLALMLAGALVLPAF